MLPAEAEWTCPSRPCPGPEPSRSAPRPGRLLVWVCVFISFRDTVLSRNEGTRDTNMNSGTILGNPGYMVTLQQELLSVLVHEALNILSLPLFNYSSLLQWNVFN